MKEFTRAVFYYTSCDFLMSSEKGVCACVCAIVCACVCVCVRFYWANAAALLALTEGHCCFTYCLYHMECFI